MIREVHLRRLDVQRRAVQVRGGHAGHRRRHRPRRGARLPRRTSAWSTSAPTSRTSTDYALDVLPRDVPGIRIHGPLSATTAPASSPSTCRGTIRTTWPRCSTARRSPSAPATTARCRSTSGSARRPAARASFNIYTDRDDIDRLADGAQQGRAHYSRDRPDHAAQRQTWTTFTATRSSSTTATRTTSARSSADDRPRRAPTRCAATASR